MTKTIARIVGAMVGLTLITMLVVGSFVGALHHPSPHRLPVGVVGPVAEATRLEAMLALRAPGAFAVKDYPDAGSARQAILNRAVDGALILGQGQQRLLVAGAAGRFVADAVTMTFQAEAAAAGQQLVVQDIRPLPPGDENGVSPFLFYAGIALPAIAFGIVLGAIGKPLPAAGRLGALAGFAVLAGLAAVWVADGMAGALAGAPLGLAGIGALAAFAIGAASSAALRLAGPPLAALAILLFVPIGIPAAGGPFGATFVPAWYGHLGAALPAGAAVPAIRNIVYFNGNALGSALLVLSLWAAIAIAVHVIPPLSVPRRQSRLSKVAAHSS